MRLTIARTRNKLKKVKREQTDVFTELVQDLAAHYKDLRTKIGAEADFLLLLPEFYKIGARAWDKVFDGDWRKSEIRPEFSGLKIPPHKKNAHSKIMSHLNEIGRNHFNRAPKGCEPNLENCWLKADNQLPRGPIKALTSHSKRHTDSGARSQGRNLSVYERDQRSAKNQIIPLLEEGEKIITEYLKR